MKSGKVDPTVASAELLESRRLLAATIVDGVLVGTGTSGNDVFSVRRVLMDDVTVTINGVAQTFDMDDFTGVRLEGLGGNDTFQMIDALVSPVVRQTTVLGGAGDDTVDYSTRTQAIDFWIDPTGPSENGIPGATSGAQRDEFTDVETIIGGSGNDLFSYAQRNDPDANDPTSYRLEGRGGDDTFRDLLFPTKDAFGGVTMLGGDGNDSFRDESDQRFINDHFFGEAGNDTATRYQHGGTLDGGPGIDLLHFEDGGGDLRDFPGFENATAVPRIDAPDDTITLTGTDGPNTLSADGTRVHINGLGGDDAITGGSEDDTLSGGDGKDTLIGGSGDDELHGDAGSDWLTGQEGNDTLDGGTGAGTDTLDGDGGSNTNLNGEVLAGQQVAIGIVNRVLNVIGTGAGESITLERTGIDDVFVRAGSRTAQFDMDDFNGVSVLGLGGNDVITITHALVAGSLVRKVTIDGGSGNDSLTGNAGDDVLRGGDGADTLIGLAGRDALFGGAGNDRLFGGLGLDFLDGGNNDDFIDASDSAGDDTVLGGSGSDTAKMDNGDSASSVEAFV
jgi:Ca2+-binding RTX toxin-like protein